MNFAKNKFLNQIVGFFILYAKQTQMIQWNFYGYLYLKKSIGKLGNYYKPNFLLPRTIFFPFVIYYFLSHKLFFMSVNIIWEYLS